MIEEDKEQYIRGAMRLYIENAALEELIDMKHAIEHWIEYLQELKEKRDKDE